MSIPFEPHEGLILVRAELEGPVAMLFCDWRLTRARREL